ncbi:MAG: hypothetical protein ACLGI2_07305 [Acidimicrobiia bacterium]
MIDEAYVNRVLAGLDAIVGDVVRMVVQTKTIPREAVDRLKAVYATDSLLDRILDSLSRDVAFRLPTYRSEPGNKKSGVVELLSGSASCLFAKVSRDYSEVAANPTPGERTEWVALRPLDPSRDPAAYNTPAWAYIYEGFQEGGHPPVRDPCAP